MFADANGKLTSSSRFNIGLSGTGGINASRDSAGAGYTTAQYANTNSSQIVVAKAKGSKAAPVAMAVNDVISGITMLPYTGNGSVTVDGVAGFASSGAFTQAVVTELPTGSGNLAGTRMVLGTTNATSNLATNVLELNSDRSATFRGNVSFAGGIQEATQFATSVSGTFAPNPNSGTMMYVTLGGNFTFNGFNSTVNNQGKSMAIVFQQDATGSRIMTSNSALIKWMGGNKTLSTAGNAIDVVSIFYDGNFYYASLSKGYV
jgi:hypothetical protein